MTTGTGYYIHPSKCECAVDHVEWVRIPMANRKIDFVVYIEGPCLCTYYILLASAVTSSQQHTKSLVGIEGVYTSQQQQQCPCRKSSSLSRLRTFGSCVFARLSWRWAIRVTW